MRKLIFMCIQAIGLFVACTNTEREQETLFRDFVSHQFDIPYSSLDRKICIPNEDTIMTKGNYRYVTYLDSTECMSCGIHLLKQIEQKIMNDPIFDSLKVEYIISISKSNRDVVYRNLCKNRLHGSVYFDYNGQVAKKNPRNIGLLHRNKRNIIVIERN